jgi:hypothetical protein
MHDPSGVSPAFMRAKRSMIHCHVPKRPTTTVSYNGILRQIEEGRRVGCSARPAKLSHCDAAHPALLFHAGAQRPTIAAAEEASFRWRATARGAAGCVLLLAETP